MTIQAFQISVRELVEFVYRSGDLDLRFQGKSKMADGIKIHQKIQKSQGSAYEAEVTLQKTVSITREDARCVALTISGRADGILKMEHGYLIDEIKGTSQSLEHIEALTYPVHWAQAKIYGAIFCEQNHLDCIEIQLTYAHFESSEIKRLRETFSAEALMEFLEDTVSRYEKWLLFKSDWAELRKSSLDALAFPFDAYRSGQRQLAVNVYNTIKEGGVLYSEAPTGTGKTMSTLFPAIKAMSQGLVERIFYLSAKTITKVVAEEAIERMREKSDEPLMLKNITLTAKDKICINDQVTCYPEKCIYASRYYDKSLDALWDIITHENQLTKELVTKYAKAYEICPYEFSLDCALFMDIIICDYNYAFDPRVYLRRFFEFPTENYVFLVDEAHNLVDRARMMYSAEIHKEKIYAVKKHLEKNPRDEGLKKAINGINKALLEVRKRCDEQGIYVSDEEVSDLYEQFKKRSVAIEKWLTENHQAVFYDEVLEVYFDLLGYLRISELYDSGYKFYILKGNSNDTVFKLFNINPATQLKRFIDNSRATVFFSATLTPIEYYTTLLTGDTQPKALSLPSPFDPKRRKILYATDVSMKYQDRDDAIPQVTAYIRQLVSSKRGNYLVFFPSYAYMQKVHELFDALHQSEYDIIKQRRDLSDDEKAEFLNEFELSLSARTSEVGKSLIGFAVLGGHFSEGIDLKGDLLIGVMIIGVGLPMINFENDLIKTYFDASYQRGFEFAYQYPGVNKVMQSAGRVIRDERDSGIILLVDQRYRTPYYRKVLPRDWGKDYTTLQSIEQQLSEFWEEYS